MELKATVCALCALEAQRTSTAPRSAETSTASDTVSLELGAAPEPVEVPPCGPLPMFLPR